MRYHENKLVSFLSLCQLLRVHSIHCPLFQLLLHKTFSRRLSFAVTVINWRVSSLPMLSARFGKKTSLPLYFPPVTTTVHESFGEIRTEARWKLMIIGCLKGLTALPLIFFNESLLFMLCGVEHASCLC